MLLHMHKLSAHKHTHAHTQTHTSNYNETTIFQHAIEIVSSNSDIVKIVSLLSYTQMHRQTESTANYYSNLAFQKRQTLTATTASENKSHMCSPKNNDNVKSFDIGIVAVGRCCRHHFTLRIFGLSSS